MVEGQTHNWKVASSSLGPAGIVSGGSECTALSPPSIPQRGALEQGTDPPTAPLGTAAWIAAHCCGCVCVCSLLCVCTWMGKYRARIPSMGHHIWLYVTSLSLRHFKHKSLQRPSVKDVGWQTYTIANHSSGRILLSLQSAVPNQTERVSNLDNIISRPQRTVQTKNKKEPVVHDPFIETLIL